MNGLKALKGTAVALSLMALAGCGQSYNPGPEEHIAGPRDQGDVFGSNPDAAPYKTVTYEVLRSFLVDTLHMPQTVPVASFAGTPCAGLAVGGCPLLAPVPYLDANAGQLGVANYDPTPDGTQAPSLMSSGGFKVWILAASSACGMAMQNATTREELFPAAAGGISNYNNFYGALLGRAPTAAEIAELDVLQASFGDDAHKAASVCTTTFASLEALSGN